MRTADVLGHLQDRQQVLQLGIACRFVAEDRQRVVVVGDRLADVLRQAPGARGVVADHRMVGVQHAVLGVHHPAFVAGGGVGLFQHRHVVREALEHQRDAAVVEQAESVGFVHRFVADPLGQAQAAHGHVLGGVPETVEGDDGVVAHLTLDRLGVDQVDHRTTAQQVHRALDRSDAIGQAEERRVHQFQESPGKARVLADQPGNVLQVRIGHDLLHLQVDHDLGLRRHADALQGLADLLGGEFLDHEDGGES